MSYLPQDNRQYFENVDLPIVDWLRQFSKDQNETYIRSWLGRMLFTGEENLKPANVHIFFICACKVYYFVFVGHVNNPICNSFNNFLVVCREK